MYRLIRREDIWYAVEIESVEDDMDNIEGFIEQNDVVILTQDLSMFADIMLISEDDIVILVVRRKNEK